MVRRVDATRWGVALLLFISGATGLTYEVGWSRAVAEVIGSSGEASAVVLATFLGGLALGAFLFGRRSDRSPRPLRLYGFLEVGVGVAALLLPIALDAGARVYLAVAPSLPPGLRLVSRAVLTGSVLLVPTALMGGTLPALVRHFTAGLPQLRPELARLYAVNSLGAALGAGLTGVVLLPALGLSTTLRAAAIANLAVGLIAIVLGRRAAVAEPELPHAALVASPDASRRAWIAATAGLALTGFSALLGEVAFIRLLALVLGSSPYAFTLIVTAYVAGIGLGSLWLARRTRETDSQRLFGLLQLLLVVAVSVAVPLYVRLPYLFWGASHALRHTPATWPLYQLLTFGTSMLVVGVPAFLLGAAFPCGVRVVTLHARTLGADVGRAYLFNMTGTVLGAGLGGLWLLPALGLEGIFALTLAGHLLAAFLSLAIVPIGKARTWGAAGTIAALVLLVAFQRGERGWSELVAAAGTFRLREPPPPSFAALRTAWTASQRVLFRADDASASVVVTEDRRSGEKALLINGKADASSTRDLETQVLLGQMGALLHPREIRRALVIGLGSGVTAGAVLTHPVERLDVVELSPAVAQAVRLFAKENRGALDDPRLHLHVEDARTFLRGTRERYDLIVSEPSNPWTAGSASLFTRDVFREAAERLNEDGVIVQWIHTYESSEALVKLVIRTLRETFPHAVTWLGPQDLLLIASRRPLQPTLAALQARMERPSVREDLARVGIDGPVTLLGLQMQGDAAQGRYAGAGAINTADRNLLEFAAPIAFFVDEAVHVPDERLRPEPEPLLLQANGITLNARQLQTLYRTLRPLQPTEGRLLQTVTERWSALDPGSDDAAWAMALCAYARKDLGAAAQAIQTRVAAGARSPEILEAYFRVATARAQRSRSVFQPDYEAADPALARWAAEHLGDRPEVQAALRTYAESLVTYPVSSAPAGAR